MSNKIEEPTRNQGSKIDPGDLFYIEWARETVKQNIAIATDALQRLVTLNCALLGGSLVLYSTGILPAWIQRVVVIPFFLSLICSVYGMIPKPQKADPNDPASIRDTKERTLKGKMYALYSACTLLLVGFLLCLITIPFGSIFASPASRP